MLGDLVAALASGEVRVVDLTQPLSERTPVLFLPEPFANTPGLSRAADQPLRRCGARVGVGRARGRGARRHPLRRADPLDHRPRRRGRGERAAVPARRAGGGDRQVRRGRSDPDYLLTLDDIRAFESEHGPLPEGGWLLLRTGWDSRASDQEAFLNGGHTPGPDAECARWLAEEAPITGFGVETVGTDAGIAHSFEPAFPVHHFLLGAGRYGITQLANLAELPPTGAVIVVAPLKLVDGTGSPSRVLALV